MQYLTAAKQCGLVIVLVTTNLALAACSSIISPVDQAYYTGGDAFLIKGGYTRTIFSPSNF